MPVQFTCSTCQVVFYRPASARARFCSRACAYAGLTRPLADRFWDRVVKSEDTDCWLWQGPFTPRGYGLISEGGYCGQALRAHRVSWEIHCGAIPDGLWVLHKCDNPPCVNPDHLFLGTVQDNNADMVAKGRHSKGHIAPELRPRGDRHYAKTNPERLARGEASGMARLTEVEVLAIRAAFATGTVSKGALARQYGVWPRTIAQIVLRLTWTHI